MKNQSETDKFIFSDDRLFEAYDKDKNKFEQEISKLINKLNEIYGFKLCINNYNEQEKFELYIKNKKCESNYNSEYVGRLQMVKNVIATFTATIVTMLASNILANFEIINGILKVIGILVIVIITFIIFDKFLLKDFIGDYNDLNERKLEVLEAEFIEDFIKNYYLNK